MPNTKLNQAMPKFYLLLQDEKSEYLIRENALKLTLWAIVSSNSGDFPPSK